MGNKAQEERNIRIHMQSHLVVQEKLAQSCKAIIFQLTKKKKGNDLLSSNLSSV